MHKVKFRKATTRDLFGNRFVSFLGVCMFTVKCPGLDWRHLKAASQAFPGAT